MKAFVAIALLAAVGLSAEQEPRLALPTREDVLALPIEQQLAAREAVKKVMLHRVLRQKDDAARLTTDNAKECLALAGQLPTMPEPLIRMLEREASGQLSGRELHEYRDAFAKLVAAYGVDMMLMRLYSENQAYTTAEMRRVFEWLPLQHVFNLVPTQKPDSAAIQAQFMTLQKIFTRMTEVYAGVNNREQADAAAEALIPLLEDFDATSPVRLMLAKEGQSPRLMRPFEYYVQPVAAAYVAQRRRLIETEYYGSRRLSTLDFLLN